MEVYVILLRSIRRRLVTGFTIALVLLLLIAGAAIWGLMSHQEAVSRLQHIVSERPDPNKLMGVVTTIQCPFYEIDVSKVGAIRLLRKQLTDRVAQAEAGVLRFLELSEEQPDLTDLRESSRFRATLMQRRIGAVRRDLGFIKDIVNKIDVFDQGDPKHQADVQNTAYRINGLVSQIAKNLHELPNDTYVASTLSKELAQSKLLMRRVWILVASALLTYAITIYCGFRWISNPLRAIRNGASRIANGDTRYRLGRVLPWDDEFFNLTTDFNRMADRFQDAEKDLAAKVEERSRQLVRSERLASVGCLAAGVAHEINNPLSAITIAAQSIEFRLMDVLDPDHEDTPVVMERLAMIQTESKRCGQITGRLLDFSRNEKQEKISNDLTRVIGEVLAMVRPMSKYQDRKIVFDRVEPLMIEINASQMKQVVLNLVTNGLQATGGGGLVEIRVFEQTDWVVVQIKDNGHGMTDENREQLFEPFYSTKETGEGTGLGLSITNRIVEDHFGTIEPFSDGPGKGSTFSVKLPRRQPAQKAA